MNLFLLPLLSLLQKDKWFQLILHSLTYLQIAQLKHPSVLFSHFLLIDLYISFQNVKYSYFHVQLYHIFSCREHFTSLHFRNVQKSSAHLCNLASTCGM